MGVKMGKDVIIACDFNEKNELVQFLDKFEDEKLFLKIGMELFYAEGLEIVRYIKGKGHKIFLDLKLHDIPNTVKKTMKVLSQLDVDMCNVHATGGTLMMKAAVEGVTKLDGTRPILIAVTQLTSTSQEVLENELLVHGSMEEVVVQYAKNAKQSGVDGVVCSPWEAELVHKECGKGFVTVTPGVRFASDDVEDQVRIMTPAKAREAGSDYIVVGRPITQAKDPVEVFRKCKKEFCD